jgi:hypothetical protein
MDWFTLEILDTSYYVNGDWYIDGATFYIIHSMDYKCDTGTISTLAAQFCYKKISFYKKNI